MFFFLYGPSHPQRLPINFDVCFIFFWFSNRWPFGLYLWCESEFHCVLWFVFHSFIFMQLPWHRYILQLIILSCKDIMWFPFHQFFECFTMTVSFIQTIILSYCNIYFCMYLSFYMREICINIILYTDVVQAF